MKPVRIQRKRTRGWIKPIGAINCTRPGKYGNPFIDNKKVPEQWIDKLDESDYFHFIKYECGYVDSVENAIYLFKKYVLPTMDISELKGKDLMCFCALDQICHVDSLLEKSNE